jgi:hypothetical protein
MLKLIESDIGKFDKDYISPQYQTAIESEDRTSINWIDFSELKDKPKFCKDGKMPGKALDAFPKKRVRTQTLFV